MSSNKVVRVTYSYDDLFCIPKNINLDDKTQVKEWWVRYNQLHIELTNGKELVINGYKQTNFSNKFPHDQEIIDAEDADIDDDEKEDFNEEFKEVELGVGEKKKEETEKQEVYSVMQMYSSPKGNTGECETICRFETLEEAKEFWKDYCECNSTYEYFAKTGYNCFYIYGMGFVEEAHDTGFFDSCDEMFDEESDEEESDEEE